MNETIISVQGLGKKYTLGQVHTNLLSERMGNGVRSLINRVRGRGRSSLAPDLSKEKDFWALKDVSFEVKQGEVAGIIGRNGAGKSTLLKILARITEPTEGRIELYGRVASLLEVGTGFHPELTGRENVFLNGAILGMSKAEIKKKFDEIAAFAEVEKFIDTPVKRYSSGMYVRLAFAVAAHLEPEILIVDEVLAVGDVQFQKKCMGKMGDIAKGGRTVLFVSHNMASIKSLCTSVTCLDYGMIIDRGDPAIVIGKYLQGKHFTDACSELPTHLHAVKSSLEIEIIEILNSEGARSEIIRFDENIVIKMRARSEKAIPNVRLGIGIHAENLRIATFHTPPVDFPESKEGKYFLCRISANTLLPGFYTVHVGAHSVDSGRALDWVPDAISFRVSPIAKEAANSYDEYESGVVRLPVHWEGDLLQS